MKRRQVAGDLAGRRIISRERLGAARFESGREGSLRQTPSLAFRLPKQTLGEGGDRRGCSNGPSRSFVPVYNSKLTTIAHRLFSPNG